MSLWRHVCVVGEPGHIQEEHHLHILGLPLCAQKFLPQTGLKDAGPRTRSTPVVAAVSQGATRCSKDAACSTNLILLPRGPSALGRSKLLFVYQAAQLRTHTQPLRDLHKDVLMMCSDYGPMDWREMGGNQARTLCQEWLSRHLHNIKTKLVEP